MKLTAVELSLGTNNLQSEVVFSCLPVLEDVLDPASIEIEVLWFVEDKNVYSEAFLASSKTAGSLTEEHWSLGQTVGTIKDSNQRFLCQKMAQILDGRCV